MDYNDDWWGRPQQETVTFLLQNNHVELMTGPVARYARRNNIPVIDRSSSSNFDPDNCGVDWTYYHRVFPFGSAQFIRKIQASKLGWRVMRDPIRFTSEYLVEQFGYHALNCEGRAIAVGHVADYLRKHGERHLRPELDHKAFAGKVYSYDSWMATLAEKPMTNLVQCWMTPTRPIEAEWRCWIIDGKVVSISQYRRNNQMDVKLDTQYEVKAAAQHFASIHLPHPCVVMDIALTESGYKVVEFNSIHTSGWYAADIDQVLDQVVLWLKRCR